MNLFLGVFSGIGLSACAISVQLPEDAAQLTDSPSPSPSPSASPSGPSLVQKKVGLAAYSSCGITSSGTGQCWGNNDVPSDGTSGMLGIGLGTSITRTTPQTLDDPGQSYLSIAAGEWVVCGLTSLQTIKCWGTWVGDGTSVQGNSPIAITDTSTFVDLAAGSYHACGVKSDGVMKCWGDGWDGKLGNGDAGGATQYSPVTADSGTLYARVAAGRNHTCGITTAGVLRCWGTNSAGQVGDGTTAGPRLSALEIDPGVTYSVIAAGENNSCGITTAGVLKCWGANGSGQVGDGTTVTKSSPTVVDGGVSYAKVSVATSGYHACAVTSAGVLKCWGNNGSGRLGNGDVLPSSSPVVINSGVAYREVAAGGSHSCGITVGGELKCWGANGDGRLGIGNTTGQTLPALVGSGY